jgi:hypothetical protein
VAGSIESSKQGQAGACELLDGRPPNKGMKLTKPEHNGASQLIPGVGRTLASSSRFSFIRRLVIMATANARL